jgi:hypothetical protein
MSRNERHLSEEDLVLLYYREPGAPESAPAHLAACSECRAASEALARTLNLCNEWNVPEPDREFERSVWARMVPQLESLRSAATGRRWFVAFAAAAAVCLLIVGAFAIGRISRRAEPSITAGLSQHARERILAISLADHLDRAEMLMTEISNASDTDVPRFGAERRRAQDLVEEGRLMRQTLAIGGQTGTLNLLDDVERFMLEVANAPDQMGPEELRELQGRIGAGSLLFKVRIIESNLRTQGQKS